MKNEFEELKKNPRGERILGLDKNNTEENMKLEKNNCHIMDLWWGLHMYVHMHIMVDIWVGMGMHMYVCMYVCVCENIYMVGSRLSVYIKSVSQKWVHPSHFCRYLSISLRGTTLTKWHFDSMKISLSAAYITELIYFPLKITQYITIKS